MDTIFMNSKNSKSSKSHFLVLKLTNKLDLRIGEKVIQDNFEYILEKHEEDIDKPPVQTYVNKIENRIAFKIQKGYSLELLTPETMKLFGSTENKITKDKNGENAPHLKITEVVLVLCDIVNNDYQQDSRVLYKFVPNKPFASLLETSLTNDIFFKKFN